MSFFIIILLNSFFHPKQIRASILINVVLSFQHNQFSYTRQKHIQHTKQQQTNTDPQKACMNIYVRFLWRDVPIYVCFCCLRHISITCCVRACLVTHVPLEHESGWHVWRGVWEGTTAVPGRAGTAAESRAHGRRFVITPMSSCLSTCYPQRCCTCSPQNSVLFF